MIIPAEQKTGLRFQQALLASVLPLRSRDHQRLIRDSICLYCSEDLSLQGLPRRAILLSKSKYYTCNFCKIFPCVTPRRLVQCMSSTCYEISQRNTVQHSTTQHYIHHFMEISSHKCAVLILDASFNWYRIILDHW